MRLIFLFLLNTIFCLTIGVNAIANVFEITVHITGLKNDTVYLGNHFGDKQYVKDTIILDNNGWGTFENRDSMPGGIYLVVLSDKTYFEFIVNEQKFKLETDTIDFVLGMKVTGSLENKLFNEYQRFIIEKTKESKAIQSRLDKNSGIKDSLEIIWKLKNEVDSQVKDYRNKIIANYPNTFFAKILITKQDPEVALVKDSTGVIKTSNEFYFYRSHYLSNIDFSDERLLRTPFFYEKIKTYTRKLTTKEPDSIIQSVDTVLFKAKANLQVYKFCRARLYNYYDESKVAGHKEVAQHINFRYHETDTIFKNNFHPIIYPLKLGDQVHDLILPDSANQMHVLHEIKSKYTLLVFWDTENKNCVSEIPLLHKFYEREKAKGIEVFAVCLDENVEKWKKYISDNELKWINVFGKEERKIIDRFYDIFALPVIYLLDEEMKVVAKRLTTERLKEFMKRAEKKKKY